MLLLQLYVPIKHLCVFMYVSIICITQSKRNIVFRLLLFYLLHITVSADLSQNEKTCTGILLILITIKI